MASPLYQRSWLLQLLETFAVWSVVPVPLLIAAALVWRVRLSTVWLAIPLLWFIFEYGSLFMPEMGERARASVEAPTLRVMTFNTWKKSDETGEFSAALHEWQPDLVALQEVGPRLLRDLRSLSDDWPYQLHMPIRSSTRIAFLSKFPIVSYEADNSWSGCHCAQFLVDWHGQTIRVVVVHIRSPDLGAMNVRGGPIRVRYFDTSEQEKSYSALLPIIESSEEPVILMGDFNTTERQKGYASLLDAGFRNAHVEAGWGLGLTYPARFTQLVWLPFPVIRIDHIFYDGAWTALKTWNLPLIDSDHLALVADLEWFGDD